MPRWLAGGRPVSGATWGCNSESLLAASPTPADLLLIPPAADGRNQADQLPVNVAPRGSLLLKNWVARQHNATFISDNHVRGCV